MAHGHHEIADPSQFGCDNGQTGPYFSDLLTPTEGAHIMSLVETFRRTLETSELEARVAALEGEAA